MIHTSANRRLDLSRDSYIYSRADAQEWHIFLKFGKSFSTFSLMCSVGLQMRDVCVFVSVCEVLPACMVGCIEDKLLFLIVLYPALIAKLMRLWTAGLRSVKTEVPLHFKLWTKQRLKCTGQSC